MRPESLWGDVTARARFFRRAPGVLPRAIDSAGARRGPGRPKDRRQADCLALMDRAVYESPPPFLSRPPAARRRSSGNLDRRVRDEGVEGATRALVGAGVYVTVEGLEGRRPVARGSLSFPSRPHDVDNPGMTGHVPARSGGSRSLGTIVLMDLEFIRDAAEDTYLLFETRGAMAWTQARWQAPGRGVIARLLEYARFGQVAVYWFRHVDPGPPGSARDPAGARDCCAGLAPWRGLVAPTGARAGGRVASHRPLDGRLPRGWPHPARPHRPQLGRPPL